MNTLGLSYIPVNDDVKDSLLALQDMFTEFQDIGCSEQYNEIIMTLSEEMRDKAQFSNMTVNESIELGNQMFSMMLYSNSEYITQEQLISLSVLFNIFITTFSNNVSTDGMGGSYSE